MKKRSIKYRFTIVICLFFALAYNLSTYFFTFSEYVTKISSKETGVSGSVVTINDLEIDYNYYMGLNYTDSDGTLPTAEDNNIYNENNLVETKISYFGYDISKTNYGYVSLDEKQDTYVYYKIYPVNDNGTEKLSDDYLEIDLIDNPYTDRPNDMGFNSWVTDYEDAEISFYNDYYIRRAKIPVTYTDEIPNPIEINFYAGWTNAKVETVNSNSNWTSAFANLDSEGMNQIGGEVAVYESVAGLYLQGTVSFMTNYPTGAVNNRGQSLSGRCNSFFSSCTYYLEVEEGAEYDSTLTYYQLSGNGNNASMSEYEVQISGYEQLPYLEEGTLLAGYFKQKNLSYGTSIVGYYDSLGTIQESGTCTTSGGCTYYEMFQYYDEDGNENKADGVTIYYLLATRETNIIVMDGNVSSKWSSSETKPFTLTSIHNDNDYTGSVTWTVNSQYITCYNDTVIENIQINSNASSSSSNPSSSSTASGYIYANYYNLKIGRGIIQYNSNKTFNGVFGGNNNTSAIGSSDNVVKYSLVVESGFYNTITLTNGPSNTNRTKYIEAKGIYGNDYDRALEENDNLDVYFEASGSWGAGNYYASTNTGITFDTTIKSGKYGTGKSDHTTGVYVGGRSYGTHYTSRKIKVEGGWIYNLIGGPLTASNRAEINDTYIYMTGGEIDMIIGGAGTSTTYGNRIISVTGGTVNYSVFGGSNSYSGSSSDGELTGSSFVYIGGNTTIGNSDYISNGTTLWGAESGSVFGIGNGNSSSSSIGTNENSNIIIDAEAEILGNVYGGGNYSATGIATDSSTTSTTIKVIGGTINGSLYGGGNKNGSGSSEITSTININLLDGNIKGNIYGGSKEQGTIYGDTKINVTGGTIGSIFGGGQGSSTKVANNVEIIYGDINLESTPVTTNNIYGGSELGTVNGTGTSSTSYKTTITINKGKINGSVFGGAKGDDSNTPYVLGDVLVTINGGTINSVFGGNDYSGTPSKNIEVYLNGGTITNAYGGGNKTSLTTSNIYLNGATVTNLFGGSNESGNVATSNITIESGKATTIYGGNNIGGVTNESNIVANGGEITTLYGGGKLTSTPTTNITINSSNIKYLYGGGEESSTTTSNITVNDGEIGEIFGGSNIEGDVTESNISIYNGEIETIYGGNNVGGKTIDSIINIEGATITNVYGGGNNATTDNTSVIVNDGIITNVYGGGNNTNGIVTNATIELNSGVITNLYGGGNKAHTDVSNINFQGSTITNLYGGGNESGINDSNINLISGYADNMFGGSNKSGTVNNVEIKTSEDIEELRIENLYGGNNEGGLADISTITLTRGEYGNIYGGGNQAELNTPALILENITVTGNIYGGGNEALVTENTEIILKNSIVNGSVFGGGNAGIVNKDTSVYVSASTIGESIYAGGNGSTAIVIGSSILLVDGNTTVNKHVFGGGNAANTGLIEDKTSTSEVYVVGATINGNVYGGGNTSVLYGRSIVNVGIDTFTNGKEVISGDIIINGTVFGGGEANEEGSENYDFSHISVTDGTQVNINGNNHEQFTISGSIFGSGNASSTSGESYINISNYGTNDNIQNNISIQRADMVILDNSHLELMGATDRTNEYSTVLFSISRIKHLKLKNNSTIYLNNGANLLEEYTSATDINGEEILATIEIVDGQVTKNVDNRIFIQGGKNLNVATNENATAYGIVNGMTFFGMYTKDRNGLIVTGYYSNQYNHGDTISSSDLYMFDSGSYVLGYHKANHDITKDGFYSNYSKEGILNIEYVKPTPDDSTYYMWSIGEQVVTIEMTLTASKYITLGTEELSMLNYSDPNTTFSIVGFNYNDLDSNVNLKEESEIPRIAETTEEADNNMSLVMKSTNSGWIANGETTFLTTEENNIKGTTSYKSENSTEVPNFQFYLYHSKNLGSSGNMGSVTISFVVITPIDDITNEVERINLVVNLNRALYNTNDYEAAMTIGKEYDMFASTNVNLTTDGSLSAYYSLFTSGEESIYKEGYHRALVSTYAFPVNTKLTLINLNEDSVNEYYYYVVTEDDYNASLEEYNKYGECSYQFSKFIRMGSTSETNNFNDEANNIKYYDSESGNAFEEFIVIVDFIDSNITNNVLDKSLLIELRNAEEKTIVSVLGIEQEKMVYSLYANSNAVVDVEGTISSEKIYPGKSVKLNITTNFNRKTVGSEIIHDTNYFDQQLGVKISYLDSNNNQVTGASLLGVTYVYDGVTYYPRMDGSVRINLAEKMANVASNITINTTESVAAGDYTMVIESFGSSDGIYYGEVSSDTTTLPVNVLDTVYGLSMKMGDYIVMVDKDTGNNLNANNDLRFNLKYSSGLTEPQLSISLYRRNYSNIYSLTYELVDLADYVSDTLVTTNNKYEYLLASTPLSDVNYNFTYKDNLKTGTYKLVVSLYDKNTHIGDVYKYIVIKERYNG